MKTLESFFRITTRESSAIQLPSSSRAAVAKWLKLIDVIQYIAFAFGLGLLTLLIGVVGLSLLGIRQNRKHKEVKRA